MGDDKVGMGPITADESFPLKGALKGILWTEVVVYLGVGLYMFLAIDLGKMAKPPWASNPYALVMVQTNQKMHATLAIMMSYVAMVGLDNGHVTRMELDFLFLSLALIMNSVFAFPVPFCVAARIPLLKPEFWLQLVLWCTCANLARPSILIPCGSINAYGLIVWVVKGRNNWAGYDAFRADVAEAEGDEAAGKFDKLCCRATSTSEDSASNGTDSEEKCSGAVPLLETV